MAKKKKSVGIESTTSQVTITTKSDLGRPVQFVNFMGMRFQGEMVYIDYGLFDERELAKQPEKEQDSIRISPKLQGSLAMPGLAFLGCS